MSLLPAHPVAAPVGDVHQVATAFVMFNDAFLMLEGVIRRNSDGMTEDQRRMVARWIDSSSVMILGAHKTLATAGRAQ